MDPDGERCMRIRGARVHNLRDVDVDIPLGRMIGIAGVSGSGKSSLALGVIYSEGSRRYLEALSTYTRRRLTQASVADVDSIENVPAALALHQRPGVPGIRSTFGTMTELLNGLRLMMSRLGTYSCPNGHEVPPSSNVASERPLICPTCGVEFHGISAEEFSFNSKGACERCTGTGIVREVDQSKLIPDESKTLKDGAVTSWNQMGIQWMYLVAGQLGVRVDVPYRDLTPEEKEIVLHGEEQQIMTPIVSSTGKLFDLNATYRNAYRAVEEGLNNAKTEKAIERVDRFLTTCPCDQCRGTRINERARSVRLCGMTLPEICSMSLGEMVDWVSGLPGRLPAEMSDMATVLSDEFLNMSTRLLQLGLGYLSLDRAGSTLSTGERQRVQLAKSVRSRLIGALYVLDEPSIGLHPSNVDGLLGVMRDLVDAGNTVIVVDHDTRVLRACDRIIELGPGAGSDGGNLIINDTVEGVVRSDASIIGPYIGEMIETLVRERVQPQSMFDNGHISLHTSEIHTVKPMDVDFPRGRFIAITGVSGSGKTTLILESLVPALSATISGSALPPHVRGVEADGISRVELIDSTPIGANIRSTLSTYCGALDDLRSMFSKLDSSKEAGLKSGDFSYNTGSLRCNACDGTGEITMDVQFLPDISIVCPECGGTRYSKEASRYKWTSKSGEEYTIPELMSMTVDDAKVALKGTKCARKLETLSGLGLGYLTLGESTPSLSGGEAQRLKLASEMGRAQEGTVFIFDEPTIGLHPSDVRTLIGVFDSLLASGATVIVIEHDLDMIKNADYVIDLGPGGGEDGGTIVSRGTPPEVASDPNSPTGRFL